MIRTVKGPFRGRTRLSILLATAAAFLLWPASQALAAAALSVSVEGTGSGKVSSAGGYEGSTLYEGVPTIECDYKSPGPTTGVCENEASAAFGFEGVVLHPEAAPGSEFVEWKEVETGGFGTGTSCEENGGKGFVPGNECRVLAAEGEAANAEWFVTAVFACETEGGCEEGGTEFPLTVTKEGSGEGTVTSSPAGIECGSECEAEFEEGTEVTLSASPEAGSEFSGWSGAGCSGTGTCVVTMEEAEEVTATFDEEPTPEFELEISTDGTGTGEVECEVDGGEAEACEAEYEEGTEVALVPIAETGSEFVKWSGDCTGSGACELEMDEDKEVTATFDEEEAPVEEFSLAVSKAGTGSGTVTSSPAGINCGSTCTAEYEEGEEVTLTASAASGSTFTGWSGGGCSGTGTCKVTLGADTTVTATFTANPAPPAPTCQTDPSLCPPTPTPTPTPTPEGKAKAAVTAAVKSGKAELKLTCTGGPCKGTIQLKAKVKQGSKTKNLVIGKASFSIAEGATATLKVKLSGPAKQELAKGKMLKAKTSGVGITASTVKLKPQKA